MQGRRPQTVTPWWPVLTLRNHQFLPPALHRLVKDWRAAWSTAKWNHWKCGKTGAKKWNICLRSSGTLLALETSGDFPTFASEAGEVGANDAAVFVCFLYVYFVCFLFCLACLSTNRPTSCTRLSRDVLPTVTYPESIIYWRRVRAKELCAW